MILQCIKMAWQAITGNKMRSFLTMLGIIIGVTALVVMVSLVSGATDQVTSEIQSLGTDMISVYLYNYKGKDLQYRDIDEVEALQNVRQVAPVQQTQYTAKHGYADERVTIYGTNSAYYDIQKLSLVNGRFLKSPDLDNTTYVCALTEETAEKFFGSVNAVGQSININGRSFTVIGVLEKTSSMMSYYGEQYVAYVPYTVLSRMTGEMNINTIVVSSEDVNEQNLTADVLTEYFTERFNDPEQNSFYVDNMTALMESVGQVTNTMALLLGGIAAISLLVGGIGIMNIMLVSVTERTREIGIRKAIGAGRGSIMLQFLIEALMISLIGCAIGLLLSEGILTVAGQVASTSGTPISFRMKPNVVALAVAFSSGIGLLFGLYPANKAAKKHPIEALRYQE